MADIRMIHFNEEYIVKINGKAETDYTDEELKEVLATYPDVLAAKIKDHFAEGDDYTVKVEPVKRGKWEENGIAYVCSLCHRSLVIEQGDANMNFCPNCGARMDGDSND